MPSPRCTASDALASSRLASRPSLPVLAPASCSTRPAPRASQAPSSTAAQSCSDPENGTSTGPGRAGPAPAKIATSHGAWSSNASRRASSSRPSGASTTSSSTSCSAARRAKSWPGVIDVNAAVRAVTPSWPNRSRTWPRRRTVSPRSATLVTGLAMTSSRSDSPASWAPSATKDGSEASPNAPVMTRRGSSAIGALADESGRGRASAGSCSRIARCTSRSAAPGSMPSSATSVSRAR